MRCGSSRSKSISSCRGKSRTCRPARTAATIARSSWASTSSPNCSTSAQRRLAAMDAAGIDMQVLSHNQPGCQALDATAAVPVAREVNDLLFETVKAHPSRFAGLAALPTADPAAAALELERAVTKLGFKGAMINGHTRGSFLDDRKYWCIFEARTCTRRADLPAPEQTASRGDAGLLRRLRGTGAGGLGLRHRHRRALSADGLCRRVRRLPQADGHSRPPGRGPAVHAAPDPGPDAAGGQAPRPQARADRVPDREPRGDLQRQFLARRPSPAPWRRSGSTT